MTPLSTESRSLGGRTISLRDKGIVLTVRPHWWSSESGDPAIPGRFRCWEQILLLFEQVRRLDVKGRSRRVA